MPTTKPLTGFSKDPYLKLVRPLVEAFLAFIRVGNRHIESMGLTSAQFDVIVELGETDGLTCAELSNSTLITKGTLTGVLDRLVRKELVRRDDVEGDRRAIKVRLTKKGEALFRKVFPAHADFLRPIFKLAFSPNEVEKLRTELFKLREAFETESEDIVKKGGQ